MLIDQQLFPIIVRLNDGSHYIISYYIYLFKFPPIRRRFQLAVAGVASGRALRTLGLSCSLERIVVVIRNEIIVGSASDAHEAVMAPSLSQNFLGRRYKAVGG